MLSQIIDNQNKLLLEKEQKIKELEKELEQDKKVQVVEHFEAYGQCRDSRRIASLEKENEELKKECRRCVHTDCPCILSDYGKDRNGICDHFKDVFDENAELNDKLKNLERVAEVRLANWQKYEKENVDLKERMNKDHLSFIKLVEFLKEQYTENISDLKENLEKENAELKAQIEKMKKDLQEIKMRYDNSKDKTPINAMGAEYRLLCNIEDIIEEWEIKEK